MRKRTKKQQVAAWGAFVVKGIHQKRKNMLKPEEQKLIIDFAEKLYQDASRADTDYRTLAQRVKQFGELIVSELDELPK